MVIIKKILSRLRNRDEYIVNVYNYITDESYDRVWFSTNLKDADAIADKFIGMSHIKQMLTDTRKVKSDEFYLEFFNTKTKTFFGVNVQ